MRKRKSLGPAIKAIREAKGLSGSKVATDCLMSHSHLLNIESNHRFATPEALMRISMALGVSLDAISYEIPDAKAKVA